MSKFTSHLFAAFLLATTTMTVGAQPQLATTSGNPTASNGMADTYWEPKTRAEVRADLEMWKQAGLEKFWSRESTPDTHSPAYRAAYAKYLRLRNGSEYTDEVERELRR